MRVARESGARRVRLSAWLAALLTLVPVVSKAATFPPTSAVGYQNASDVVDYFPCSQVINTQDELDAVHALDGVWAPHAEGCVIFPYFATGTSTHFLDALSIHFDLHTPLPAVNVIFRAYLRKGAYEDICGGCTIWHQYRLYPGTFSRQDENCDESCVWNYDSFPGDRAWSGWIEWPVPQAWFDGSALDVSLRLWNAQVDAVELTADLPTAMRKSSWGQLMLLYR